MADNTHSGNTRTCIYIVTILATFLLMGFLVKQMVRVTQPAPVDAQRAAARAKDNADIRAGGADGAKMWGYVDPAKGIVRMPLDDAMKLTVQGYQNGGAFRSNLLERVEKASAPAKNVYE
jgi:hypothetical protein